MGTAAFGPAALALVTTIFSEGPERDRAVGIFSAMGALGFAAGVALGGVITEFLGWRWVMFAALPIALTVFMLTPLVIAERRPPGAGNGLDLPGAVTVALGLAALLYALSVAVERSWSSPATVGFLLLGIGLLVGFVAIERRSPAPLIPLSVFRVQPVVIVNIAHILMSTSAASTFVLMLYLQSVLGQSPVQASLLYLPLPIVGAAAAPVAGWLVSRSGGSRPTMVLGMALIVSGWLLMALMSTEERVAIVIAGGVIAAIGRVVTIVALTLIATSGLREDRRGLAAGLLGTSGQIGNAWGIGLIGAVIAAGVGDGGEVGTDSDPATLVEGLRWGVVIGALSVVLALLVVVVGLPRRRAGTVGSSLPGTGP